MTDWTQGGAAGLLAVTFTLGMGLFAVHLARVRVHEVDDPDALQGTITPVGIWSYRRRFVEVLLDVLLVSIAYMGAYRLQFEGDEFAANLPYFVRSFPLVLGTQMIALLVVGSYRGMWRYFSLSDGLTSAKGVFLGVVAAQVVMLYLYRFEGYSLAVFSVYAMLLFLLLVGSRASFRLLSEFGQRQRRTGRRLVIYGAEDEGAIVVRYLLNDPRRTYRILGFVDDDPRKRNVHVHGYRIIGGYDHLVGMIMAGEVEMVAVTGAAVASEELAQLCTDHHVSLYRLGIDW